MGEIAQIASPIEAGSSQTANTGSLKYAMLGEVHLVVSGFSGLVLRHHLVAAGSHPRQHPCLINAKFWMEIGSFLKPTFVDWPNSFVTT